MGVWIEIRINRYIVIIIPGVAPFVGVWIEIRDGAKDEMIEEVAPFVGVWIEIVLKSINIAMRPRRPLCGGVD